MGKERSRIAQRKYDSSPDTVAITVSEGVSEGRLLCNSCTNSDASHRLFELESALV